MQQRWKFLRSCVCGGLVAAMLAAVPAFAGQPITTDSRIKTLVYNANEVFAITTHYGYQSNIEFGPKEVIDTISVGDRVAWQISPSGRRLFIRAQEENAHTNMTVVTNLRAYQFDLRSSAADAVFGSEELTYVVRFFYPEENPEMALPLTRAAAAPIADPAPEPIVANALPQPAATAPVVSAAPHATSAPTAGYNYRYTYSGPSQIAPVKIFDDGKTTYFKFVGTPPSQVAVISAKGDLLDIPTRRTSDGLIAVDAIAPRFSLTQGAQHVLIYNEANGVL